MKTKYKPGMLVEFQVDEDHPMTTAVVTGVIQTQTGVMYAVEGENVWIEDKQIFAAYRRIETVKTPTAKPKRKLTSRKKSTQTELPVN